MRRMAGRKIAPRSAGADTPLGELQPGVRIYAACVPAGQRLLTTSDNFVRRQSRFDRQARLNLRHAVVEVTKAMYLDYVSSQVMAWTDHEIDALRQIVKNLRSRFADFSLGLPAKIFLVKTTGQEEGYAAYTRGLNTVCLPANMVASLSMSTSFDDPLHPGNDQLYLEDIVNHECFHLFSKNNPARRASLYAAIHYHVTGNEVELPNLPWGPAARRWSLPQLKITNPDGSNLDVYIEMEVPAVPGTSGKNVRRALLPLLLADRPYDGGIFFQYLTWQFLAIERDTRGRWIAMLRRGRPVLYDSAPLLKQYRALVGRNFDGEIFHPDEVLAQNFVLASKQPTPALLSTIQGLMSRAAMDRARKRL